MTTLTYKPGDVVVPSKTYRTDLHDNPRRSYVVLAAWEPERTNERVRQTLLLFPLSGSASQGMCRADARRGAMKAMRQAWEVDLATGDAGARYFSGPSKARLQQLFRERQQELVTSHAESDRPHPDIYQGDIPLLDEPRMPRERNLSSCALACREIREELKRAGVKGRDVKVRADNYAGGSSIRVTIMSLDVPYAVVEAAAKKHEHLRWDEYTQEILMGGNRFVHVDVDGAAQREVADAVRTSTSTSASREMSYLGCRIVEVYDGGRFVGFYSPDIGAAQQRTSPVLADMILAIYRARSGRDGARERLQAEIERLKAENERLRAARG